MKNIITIILNVILIFCISGSAYCAEPVDTITFNKKITKVIEDESVSAKGNITKKYYFLVDGELLSTTKATVQKYNLCIKHGATCKLYAVVSKSRKTIKKIIIL